jgi:hypothetical protein
MVTWQHGKATWEPALSPSQLHSDIATLLHRYLDRACGWWWSIGGQPGQYLWANSEHWLLCAQERRFSSSQRDGEVTREGVEMRYDACSIRVVGLCRNATSLPIRRARAPCNNPHHTAALGAFSHRSSRSLLFAG